MKLGVEAGRAGVLAGRIPRKEYASASSPTEGLIGAAHEMTEEPLEADAAAAQAGTRRGGSRVQRGADRARSRDPAAGRHARPAAGARRSADRARSTRPGTSCRRRLPSPGLKGQLAGFIWRVVAPYLQRQLTFNSLLVDHVNRNVAAARAPLTGATRGARRRCAPRCTSSPRSRAG